MQVKKEIFTARFLNVHTCRIRACLKDLPHLDLRYDNRFMQMNPHHKTTHFYFPGDTTSKCNFRMNFSKF